MRKLLYRSLYDVRGRNIDVARAIKHTFGGESTIIDVGCGECGLAAFMRRAKITGVDILPPASVDQRLDYIHGSILELPFKDRSYGVSASVDVLEHLPEDVRPRAVGELVRVAAKGVVVTFPNGERARAIDEEFERSLVARGAGLPEWLTEHLAYKYPEIDVIESAIRASARETGRDAVINVIFSEPLFLSRFLRWSAALSKYFYVSANVAAGVLSPLIPLAAAAESYRAIMVAEFVDSE